MAAGTTPVFPDTINNAANKAVTADTSRTSPTTGGVTIFTAGADGSRVDRISITALASTTADVVRIFLFDSSTYYLWKEITYPSLTVGTTVAPWQYTIVEPIVLKTGWTLVGATNNGDDMAFMCFGGDY